METDLTEYADKKNKKSVLKNILNNLKKMELKHQEITEKIIECFYKVYNKLGYGFIEKVYENAMIIELE